MIKNVVKKVQTSCRLVCVVWDSCQREARTDGGGIPFNGCSSTSSQEQSTLFSSVFAGNLKTGLELLLLVPNFWWYFFFKNAFTYLNIMGPTKAIVKMMKLYVNSIADCIAFEAITSFNLSRSPSSICSCSIGMIGRKTTRMMSPVWPS